MLAVFVLAMLAGFLRLHSLQMGQRNADLMRFHHRVQRIRQTCPRAASFLP